jgi:hypothetical protein
MQSISYNKTTNKYEIDITSILPKEFAIFLNDVIKYSTVIIIFNLMNLGQDQNSNTFSNIIVQITYVSLGLALYRLVINKLFEIV